MSAQVTITQLPTAGAITGSELVPIVQNGQTVQTTTGAIAASPSQTQTFLTLNQEPTLPNSRALSGGTGVGLTDGGAQSTLQVYLNGVSGSLESSSDGIIAKTSGTVTPRTLTASGAGLDITNGNGVSGNPTFQLTGIAAAIANASGTGMLAIVGGSTIAGRQIVGTTDQVSVTSGNGSGNPTIALADNAVFPGTASVTVPAGTTLQRPSPAADGDIRYNTDTTRFEAYVNGSWQTLGSGDGSVTSVTGTSNQITVANGTTTPQVALASNPVLPGSASVSVPSGNTASRPVSPVNGMMRYNTDLALFEGYIGGSWTTFSSGGSGVTSIATGTGLTGGPITSTGTISIANTAVTSGSYGAASKTLTATVNAQGQLTALADTDVAISNTQVSGLGTMSTQNANSVAITGGSIDGATIGATTPAAGTFTSATLTTGTISTAPATGNDIVNKTYVDNIVASGVTYHTPVYVESPNTSGNLNATYNNGSSGVGATLTNAGTQVALTIDGVLMTVGNRVLIYNQTNAAENGVYTVTTVGTGSTNWVLTRATDADSYGVGPDALDEGSTFFVQAGSTGAGETYTCTTVGTITFGTTAITFAQISAAQVYSAGTGLTLTGTQFSITNTAVTSGSYGTDARSMTLSVNAQGQITSLVDQPIAIAGSQITSGTVAIANGGTGQTTATAAFNALSPITTTGDLIIGNGANSATRLAIGANGYLLGSDGTTASWVPAPASGVTSFSAGTTGLTPSTGTTGAVTLAGTLAIANGGTNSTATPTAGGAGYGTGTAHAYTAAGTAGQVLTSTGASAPVWSGISGGTF